MEKKINKLKNILKAKKIIIILLLLLIIISLFLITQNRKPEEQIKKEETISNVNNGIIKNEIYKDLTFSNVSLVKENNICTLTMDVTNTSKNVSDIKEVDIEIKNKNKETQITLLGYIGENLKPNETRTISASTGLDIIDSYVKEIKPHKKNSKK